MKKSIKLMMMAVMVILMVACGGRNDRVLKAQIESGQRHCPMSMGMMGKLTKMAYDEEKGQVQFTVALNKKVSDVKDLQADPETAKAALRLSLQKGDMNKLLKMMVDADASLQVTYMNKGSKDELVLDFTAAELKDILDNPMSEEDVNKMTLANQIKMERGKIPYKIDQGLVVTDIQDNGSSLVYVCQVDEDLYEMVEMDAQKAELKENMTKMMRDKAMKRQAEVLASLGKGFEYKYVGNKGSKEVTVGFTAAELAEIAGK